MESKLKEACALLREILADTGFKNNGVCPVCSTYSHKPWCWYPWLLDFLGYPLDEKDLKHHGGRGTT